MTEVSVGELFVRLIVSLGVVIGIMAVAATVLKRVSSGNLGVSRGRPGKPVKIEVVARQTLGRRSSVAIVRAGERGLVLGVTEQRVTLLAETTADELMIEDPAPRTVSLIDDQSVVGSPWRNVAESLRDRTVRRS